MMTARTPSTIVLGALLACGCDRMCLETVDSEQGQLGFEDPFSGTLPTAFSSADPVVEGSVFCPDVAQWYEGPERTCVPISAEASEWFEPCWDTQIDGSAEMNGSCLHLTQPGVVRWNFEPRSCGVDVESPDFGPDTLTFDVRSIADLEARALWWFEERAEQLGLPEVGAAFPEDWIDPPGVEIRVATGGVFHPLLALREPGVSERVAYTDGMLRGQTVEGRPTVVEDEQLGTGVELSPDDRIRLDLELEAGIVQGPSFLGIPEADVASLELVGAYERAADGSRGQPMGVRAVARDAEGEVLRLSNVEWTAEGDVSTFVFNDVVLLGTTCTENAAGNGSQTSIVTATAAGFQQSVQLAWTAFPCEEPPPDPFENDEDLSFCACTSGESGAPAAGLLLLVLLRLRRQGAQAST